MSIYFPFHIFMVFLPVQISLQGTFTLWLGHPFISGKYLLPLLLHSTRKISALFHPDLQTEIPFWILYAPCRQELSCLESPVHNGQMNRRGGQTDIRLQGKKKFPKSRRERSWAAHLVADGLVLEPRLVQDLLQLLVVEVGHPDGLGQPCILTRLQGLGGRGDEQSLGMSDRSRINVGKNL